ncbi:MAG: hypothetical protein OXQ86_08870 [Gammaproteobacteria bacterium]|nr:hypothetical protein [Gammaproteobacteria bacterium]MDE0414029.1 hypothetical protein [Gammaproteobacteria bacterium]
MPQTALDTHAEVRKLKQAGCPEEQAEAMVDLVSRAPLNARIVGILGQMQHRLESIESAMATKSDLESLRADVLEQFQVHNRIRRFVGIGKFSRTGYGQAGNVRRAEQLGVEVAGADLVSGSEQAARERSGARAYINYAGFFGRARMPLKGAERGVMHAARGHFSRFRHGGEWGGRGAKR